jgi:Zn-dependent protease with chaperone function
LPEVWTLARCRAFLDSGCQRRSWGEIVRKLQWALLIIGLAAAPAQAEDIVDVLRRSQQQRLDAMHAAAEGSRSETVRRSFERVRQSFAIEQSVKLLVMSDGPLAETLHGHTIIANESLADMPEGERLFILAHEFGHVAGHHWSELCEVYKRWVPGEVTPQKTDPVAGLLGRDASAMSHRHEHAADAAALDTLRRLGVDPQQAFSALLRQGMQHDTATHPGTRKRVAALRAALSEGRHAAAPH